MTEKKIIKGVKAMDPRAQRMLVDTYSGMLFSVSRRYCYDNPSAKDALQEGLVRIFRYIGRYDNSKGDFINWMKKIVINESLKILEKQNRLSYREITDYNTSNYLETTTLDKLHEEDLIALIQILPIGYRVVFNMFVIEGYSHQEISQALDITSSTSRSQLTRAKKMLQQLITKQENLELCQRKG